MSTDIASSAAAGPPPGMSVRLSSNESPFGPSPRAVEAIRSFATNAHLYPDDQSAHLREVVAAHEGVHPSQVTVGNGSAALLMDIVGHACRDGGSAVAFERSFVVYRLAARNAGASYVEAATGPAPTAPGGNGYARDAEALLEQIDADTRVVLIDNPGNPTGAHLDGPQLRHLVERVPEHVTIVVDEAYHHFANGRRGYATVDELGVEHPGMVVLRTFSKSYGLAGLRVGYLTAREDLAGALDAWRVRFNVTAAAQVAAVVALADTKHLDDVVRGIVEGRERMQAGLAALGAAFTDSLGNFVTIELGEDASDVVARYAARGIGVRSLAAYGMHEQIRVSVGTPDEVTAFLDASTDVLATAAPRS